MITYNCSMKFIRMCVITRYVCISWRMRAERSLFNWRYLRKLIISCDCYRLRFTECVIKGYLGLDAIANSKLMIKLHYLIFSLISQPILERKHFSVPWRKQHPCRTNLQPHILWQCNHGRRKRGTERTPPPQWKIRRGTSPRFGNEVAQKLNLFWFFFLVLWGRLATTANDSTPIQKFASTPLNVIGNTPPTNRWRRVSSVGSANRAVSKDWRTRVSWSADIVESVQWVDKAGLVQSWVSAVEST